MAAKFQFLDFSVRITLFSKDLSVAHFVEFAVQVHNIKKVNCLSFSTSISILVYLKSEVCFRCKRNFCKHIDEKVKNEEVKEDGGGVWRRRKMEEEEEEGKEEKEMDKEEKRDE